MNNAEHHGPTDQYPSGLIVWMTTGLAIVVSGLSVWALSALSGNGADTLSGVVMISACTLFLTFSVFVAILVPVVYVRQVRARQDGDR